MRRLLISGFLTLLLPLLQFAPVSADVNNFTVSDFTADYYLTNTDPQGSMDIKEKITVNFTDNNHGILRALPEKYNGQSLHVRVTTVQRDGNAEPYSSYESNGNEVLKIGSADKTITGEHTYFIAYSVENVMRFTSDDNELDWNVNGTGWTQSFSHTSATLHLPATLSDKLSAPACFTGAYGSTASDCTVDVKGSDVNFASNSILSGGETLTFVAHFPTGTFTAPTALDWWKDHAVFIIQLCLLPLVVFFFALWHWRKNGKDLKGRGTIIPEYAPPDDLRVAEADVVNQYKLGNKAVSATIIDLAIRKYLKIIEGTSKGVLGMGKHKEYSFEQLPKPSGDTLKPHEATILSGLFPSGNTTQMKDLAKKFYTTRQSVEKSIPETLTTAGYFPTNPRKVGNILFFAAIGCAVVAFFCFSLSVAFAIGLLVSAAILFGFGLLMPRRTAKGVAAKEALEGLKLYMNVAEKDRIAMLQSPDAPYAAKSSEPTKTVELFEKLLPFAMILGVENQWAKQFEGIYTTPPDWYTGNWSTFNTAYLIGSLNSSMSAMNASFAAPSSSSSGSGGGFSGGGGGGGGGGGW